MRRPAFFVRLVRWETKLLQGDLAYACMPRHSRDVQGIPLVVGFSETSDLSLRKSGCSLAEAVHTAVCSRRHQLGSGRPQLT